VTNRPPSATIRVKLSRKSRERGCLHIKCKMHSLPVPTTVHSRFSAFLYVASRGQEREREREREREAILDYEGVASSFKKDCKCVFFSF
jgi:hypothetical protein